MENLFITHGLIIDQPWIEKILSGEKVWEMRSRKTERRGPIALIQKGTKKIVGTAYLQDWRGPINPDGMSLFSDRHCIPEHIYTAEDYTWNYAWILNDVKRLSQPIPYQHKSGAVIWVELDADAVRAINGKDIVFSKDKATEIKQANVVVQPTLSPRRPEGGKASNHSAGVKVPFAKDGTSFDKEFCKKSTGYTVGEKGDEQRFDNYDEALSYLKAMPTAKWRRPNPNGNWGIVSAVKWEEPTGLP